MRLAPGALEHGRLHVATSVAARRSISDPPEDLVQIAPWQRGARTQRLRWSRLLTERSTLLLDLVPDDESDQGSVSNAPLGSRAIRKWQTVRDEGSGRRRLLLGCRRTAWCFRRLETGVPPHVGGLHRTHSRRNALGCSGETAPRSRSTML